MLTASTIFRTLSATYNPPRTFLDFDTPFHLLVAFLPLLIPK
jgi:endonuclease III